MIVTFWITDQQDMFPVRTEADDIKEARYLVRHGTEYGVYHDASAKIYYPPHRIWEVEISDDHTVK